MYYSFFILFLIFVSCGFSGSGGGEGEVGAVNAQVETTKEDSVVLDEMLQWCRQRGAHSLGLGERIVAVGNLWQGVPYVSGTLDVEGDERLVVNLREMDCSTYVEYVVALAYALENDDVGWDDFVQELVGVRYREGVVNGYNSRLHYFAEWLQNKVTQGRLSLVSNVNGNAVLNSGVDFMSRHPQFYWQLQHQPALVDSVRSVEQKIAQYEIKYYTNDTIPFVERFIEDGDIIALVTTVEGLDISHVGFAQFVQSRLHFLHASTLNKRVELTKEPLTDYLKKRTTVKGIVVARVL